MLTPAAVVACALSVLGRAPDPRIDIRFMDSPPPGVSKNAEAFLSRSPDVIYLITTSDVFRQAQQSRLVAAAREACKKLASILVHEEWHLHHGADERSAYLAQLTMLAALHADAATISSVKRSMLVVLRAQHRERSDTLAADQSRPAVPRE